MSERHTVEWEPAAQMRAMTLADDDPDGVLAVFDCTDRLADDLGRAARSLTGPTRFVSRWAFTGFWSKSTTSGGSPGSPISGGHRTSYAVAEPSRARADSEVPK